MESRLQCGNPGVGAERQPFILDFPPEDLDPIQLRAVGRQEMYSPPFCPPPLDTARSGLAGVTRRVSHHYQGKAMRAHVGKVVERRDDLRAPDPAGMGVKIRFIRPIERAQDLQPLPTATGEFVGYPWRLPSIGYGGDQVKAGGIKIENIDLATGLPRLQPRSAVLLRPKRRLIAPVLE